MKRILPISLVLVCLSFASARAQEQAPCDPAQTTYAQSSSPALSLEENNGTLHDDGQLQQAMAREDGQRQFHEGNLETYEATEGATVYAYSPSGTNDAVASQNTLGEVVNTLRQRITLAGYMHLGYTYDEADEADPNTFEMKRAIIIVKGKITDRWSMAFMYNFGGSSKVLECYTDYRLLNGLTVRLGQFKPYLTLECPLSACDTELINRYSLATNYYCGVDGSDPLYGSQTGRDIGLMLYGDLFKGLLSYSLALMNGQGVNQKDKNDQKDVVGHLSLQPVEGLTVSGSFSLGKGCAVATSDVNPDLAVGDDYRRRRWSAGFQLKTKAIDLRSEYLAGLDGEVRSDGCYAVAAIHLPRKVDLIVAVDYFNKSHDLSDKQTDYVGGVQYWFYPRCRLQLQYTYCHQSLGDSHNLVQAQVQVRF